MSSKQGNLVGLHAIVSNFKAHLPFGEGKSHLRFSLFLFLSLLTTTH